MLTNEELFVDWDGLVYYDNKIKEYIQKKFSGALTFGGSLKIAELPQPSYNNKNCVYRITDSFISDSMFEIPGIEHDKNTWVYCCDVENNEFSYKYVIFNDGISKNELYTKDEINNILTEFYRQIQEDFVSKAFLFETEFELNCGTPSSEIHEEMIEEIMTDKLPAIVTDILPWNEITSLDCPPEDQGFYNIDGRSGYQLVFEGNDDYEPQSFAIPASGKIVAAYKYDAEITKGWLPNDPPPSFEWSFVDKRIVTIDNKEYEYDFYEYNVGNMGTAITETESWRFDIGVDNGTL